MDFSGSQSFGTLPENPAVRFRKEVEWATVVHLRKHRGYAYQGLCIHLPPPSIPSIPTNYYPAINISLSSLAERGCLARGDHGYIHVASKSALNVYTSTQFRLIVDGRIEYGIYRAFIVAGQAMTGLEFMYLSEAVKREIVTEMSECPEGSPGFERTKNDILHSRETIPYVFFQCVESPVLHIAPTIMVPHWQAEPAVAEQDHDVSPMILPEPATTAQSSAERAAQTEIPAPRDSPLATGEETLPNSPILADGTQPNEPESAASQSVANIEVVDSEVSASEETDEVPQPSDSPQSHTATKIRRRASSNMFNEREKRAREARARKAHREFSSLGG